MLILLTLFLFVILFDTLVTSKVCPILTSPSSKFSQAAVQFTTEESQILYSWLSQKVHEYHPTHNF